MVGKQFLNTVCLSFLGVSSSLLLLLEAPTAFASNGFEGEALLASAPGSNALQTDNLVGQPFSVGDSSVTLTGFSFSVKGDFNGANQPMTLNVFLQELAESGFVGDPLYTQTTQAGPSHDRLEFNTARLPLGANKQYAVLVAVEDFGDSTFLEIDEVKFNTEEENPGGILGGALAGLGILSAIANGSGTARQTDAVTPTSVSNIGSSVSSAQDSKDSTTAKDPTTVPTAAQDAVAVPTPALLPGLVGMGLKLWAKRKDAEQSA